MFRNYLTSIFRYISKNRTFTIINVSGLAIGMLACMLIAQYVLHELSYDHFQVKKDRIFRLQLDRYNKGEVTTRWASGCFGVGPDLKSNFPEVERYVLMTKSNALLSHGDALFKEENIYYASEDFFEVFSVPLIAGVDSLVLKEPFKMVISESYAKKYFGDENPVGKQLTNNGRTQFEVVGIFKDLPANSHMKVDALFSFASWLSLVQPRTPWSWQWDGFLTYVELKPKVDYEAFEAKLPAFVQQREGEELKRWDADMVFNLQRITDIHLDSDFIGEFQTNGDRAATYFLSIVAVLILIIAWINYVNLSTAKSIERAREVGVRKVMGGFRSQLVQQFLFESLLLNLLAVAVAVAGTILLTPWFSNLTGRSIDYLLFRENLFWLFMLALISGGAFLSGLYPAMVLSAYRPVEVLKGKFKNTGRGAYFRKGMVVVQFVTSITLIVGTYTVYHQISFMRSEKLGVNIDQTVVLHSPNVVDSTFRNKYEVFKERVKQNAEVSYVCGSTAVPGEQANWNAGGIRLLTQTEEEANQYRVIMMDHDFIPAYGLEVIHGRAFSGALTSEDANVMLNESGAALMGFTNFEDALNREINFWGDTFKIVGVVKDYHHESLKKEFDPMVFRYSSSPGGFYSVKFNTSDVKGSLAKFEADWAELFPGNPFNYFFLDEHYDQQYKADQQFGTVFGLFSALAIFIACLGLFGLSSLSVLQRTKEIGVRKVMGATIASILRLISRDYVVLMIIAMVFALPASWWLMNEWLNDFANRIVLSWWIFAVPCLLVIVVAMLTIAMHTLRAARANPAHSLRYE
ncbi:MAG: ABC transporter permease [Cyclobacteriaceae bacterium]